MKRIALVVLALPLCAAAAETARAELKNASGTAVGIATFVAVPGGVELALKASGLPPGPHGFHVHAVGKCEGPDFKTAGGHFNPGAKKHGLENPEGPHAGDMPNLVVGADGSGSAKVLLSGASLGSGPNSLLHEGGTALVVHADADDMKTDPAGNAGARIACGVIERSK
ncbi:MAG TPA: superoxide dismutase family protein [Anaeromyxobacteraceae bacterium]|nr:superoxide dismutase family protein [Anaeromyxobacteraceae bacterium]